jgi:uncharacterized cupin superfamily protein
MSESIGERRLLAANALFEPLGPVEGDSGLRIAYRSWAAEDGPEFGVWEAGPGFDTDVEHDEVFVVLSGTGRVEFEDGSTIDLQPGVVVRLAKGDRTSWTITERLRKLYFFTSV